MVCEKKILYLFLRNFTPLYVKYENNQPHGFGGIVDDERPGGRTPDPSIYYKLTYDHLAPMS